MHSKLYLYENFISFLGGGLGYVSGDGAISVLGSMTYDSLKLVLNVVVCNVIS